MRTRGALVRVLLAAAVAAAALLAAAPSGSAAPTWGSGCGGNYSNSDSCYFIPLAAAVVVHADGAPGGLVCPCIPPPTPLPTITVKVTLVGPGGAVTLGCLAAAPGFAQCEAPTTILASWVGLPVQCTVTGTGWSPSVVGDYECQS